MNVTRMMKMGDGFELNYFETLREFLKLSHLTYIQLPIFKFSFSVQQNSVVYPIYMLLPKPIGQSDECVSVDKESKIIYSAWPISSSCKLFLIKSPSAFSINHAAALASDSDFNVYVQFNNTRKNCIGFVIPSDFILNEYNENLTNIIKRLPENMLGISNKL